MSYNTSKEIIINQKEKSVAALEKQVKRDFNVSLYIKKELGSNTSFTI